jgi:hypothetical protein
MGELSRDETAPLASTCTSSWRISQQGRKEAITKAARDIEDESAMGTAPKADRLAITS